MTGSKWCVLFPYDAFDTRYVNELYRFKRLNQHSIYRSISYACVCLSEPKHGQDALRLR